MTVVASVSFVRTSDFGKKSGGWLIGVLSWSRKLPHLTNP